MENSGHPAPDPAARRIANARWTAEDALASLPKTPAEMRQREGAEQDPHFWIGRLEQALRILVEATAPEGGGS